MSFRAVLGAAARHASVCVSIALRGLEQPAAGVDGRPIGLHSESDGVSIARTKRAASVVLPPSPNESVPIVLTSGSGECEHAA